MCSSSLYLSRNSNVNCSQIFFSIAIWFFFFFTKLCLIFVCIKQNAVNFIFLYSYAHKVSFTGPGEKAARPSEVKDLTEDLESGADLLQSSPSRMPLPRAVPISTTSSIIKGWFKTCNIKQSLCMIVIWPDYLLLHVVFLLKLSDQKVICC